MKECVKGAVGWAAPTSGTATAKLIQSLHAKTIFDTKKVPFGSAGAWEGRFYQWCRFLGRLPAKFQGWTSDLVLNFLFAKCAHACYWSQGIKNKAFKGFKIIIMSSWTNTLHLSNSNGSETVQSLYSRNLQTVMVTLYVWNKEIFLLCSF